MLFVVPPVVSPASVRRALLALVLATLALGCPAPASRGSGSTGGGSGGGGDEEPRNVQVEPLDPPDQGPPTPTALSRLESAHAIPDAETWSRLAARPATATVSRTEVVKFLLDTQHERTIWFVDTERDRKSVV
jgi:hypothetical protein